MVNTATAVDTGSSSFSLYARAASASAAMAAADDVQAVQAVEAPVEAKVVNLSATLKYNSFEFSYRQDFGKIVLLRQEPETGEVVQQFPTDYYLEKYAESERATRQQSRQVANDVPAQAGGEATVAAATNYGASAGGAAAAPVAAAAPALPSGGVSSGAGTSSGQGRVDITI
jgi:uncharacterized FlaG/YvyC family protein